MSRAISPDLENLSSLERIIEFINGFEDIKTIKKLPKNDRNIDDTTRHIISFGGRVDDLIDGLH